VKFKKNLTDMLQNISTDLHNCSDESCLVMHTFVASCDYTNKFKQNVFNWIIHQFSQNYNAHYNITYLEHGEIKGHGPASSQSYNEQEAVTKTLLMI
jgi:hypothetical protein